MRNILELKGNVGEYVPNAVEEYIDKLNKK